MSEDYKKRLGIPEGHELVKTHTERKVKHGKDTDIYSYNEVNEKGEVVNSYIIEDTTSMYPPFTRTVSW